VDDDTYINIPALVQHMRLYEHVEDWYIGKPSLGRPLEIPDPDLEGVSIVVTMCLLSSPT